MILYYNFYKESSKDGRDYVTVNYKKFPFEVELTEEDKKLSKKKLMDKYHRQALEKAAYQKRKEMADEIAHIFI